MQIDLRTNGKLLMAQVRLDHQEYATAVVRSLNRAVEGMKTDASRKIRERYTVTNKALQPAFERQYATRQSMTAVLMATGRPLQLFGFAPRPNQPGRTRGSGVSVAVRRGMRKRVEGSFIARMSSGHVGVFKRRGKKRLPIDELYTISVPGMIAQRDVEAAIVSLATGRFEKALEQNMRFLLRKAA